MRCPTDMFQTNGIWGQKAGGYILLNLLVPLLSDTRSIPVVLRIAQIVDSQTMKVSPHHRAQSKIEVRDALVILPLSD